MFVSDDGSVAILHRLLPASSGPWPAIDRKFPTSRSGQHASASPIFSLHFFSLQLYSQSHVSADACILRLMSPLVLKRACDCESSHWACALVFLGSASYEQVFLRNPVSYSLHCDSWGAVEPDFFFLLDFLLAETQRNSAKPHAKPKPISVYVSTNMMIPIMSIYGR